MKKFIKKEWFKIIIIILLSIITISYASSQYVYYQKQQIQLREMQQEKVREKAKILSALRKELREQGMNSEEAEELAEKIYNDSF